MVPSHPLPATFLLVFSHLHPVLIRAAAVGLLLIVEAFVISMFLDGASLASRSGVLVDFLRNWGAWGTRWLIATTILFATFAIMRFRRQLEQAFSSASTASTVGMPIWCLTLHALAMLAFAYLSRELYERPVSAIPSDLLVVLWVLVAAITTSAAILAVAPLIVWNVVFRTTGMLPMQAPIAGAVACWLGASARNLWEPASKLTFFFVTEILRPLIPDLIARPERFELVTSRFDVAIAAQCSGLEGMALLLAFGVCWLILFRKEIRLPHALLLLPAGVVILFLLNSVRIATLFWIGDHGAPKIAGGGFHSQAGWLSFNAVALAICLVARRIRWFSANPQTEVASTLEESDNPVVPYLAPFLLILAAGMVSRATTAEFEWLYALRAVVAAAGLWYYRDRYRSLTLRVGWLGPAIGALIFAIWIAGEHWIASPSPTTGMPPELAESSPLLRFAWIGIRIFTAVAVVPIAEELAFRGFLLRRLISADFESVSLEKFSWISFLLSSLLFGLLHDSRWIVGTLAGMLLAFAMRRTGSIGEAIAAHAVANLMLAAYVLYYGTWNLW